MMVEAPAWPVLTPGLSSIDFFCMREKQSLPFKAQSAGVKADQYRALTQDLSLFQSQESRAFSEENTNVGRVFLWCPLGHLPESPFPLHLMPQVPPVLKESGWEELTCTVG